MADGRFNKIIFGAGLDGTDNGDDSITVNGAAFATPAIALGTAAAAGAASTVIRSDSTIVAFDATVPSTQAFGDSAATGSAAVSARRDHKHAMPANPLIETGGPTTLAFGAVANGDYLVRSGSSIIGGSPTPGGPPTGAAGGDLGGTYPNPTVENGAHLDAATVPIAALADPTTGKVIGSSGSAAAAVYPPGYELGYTQITSGVNVTATTEAGSTTIITSSAITFDGAPVMCEFFAPSFVMPEATSANDAMIVSLFESTTQIGRLAFVFFQNLATKQSFRATLHGMYRFTPSAGSHTYIVKAYVNSTTGTPSIVAGGGGTGVEVPAFVRFTKV